MFKTRNPFCLPNSDTRRLKIHQHIEDTIDNSTLHGFSYCFDKSNPIRRVIWCIMTIAALSIGAQKVYDCTASYLAHPFMSVRSRRYVDSMAFPAFSFCNMNDMRMSKMSGTKVDMAVVTMNPNIEISGEEFEETVANAAHNIKDMVVKCSFDGQKCSHLNFTKFRWSQGEICYTFNSGYFGNHKHVPVLKVNGAGVKKSLDLTLNIQHWDYYRDGGKSGIHMILHDQHETPVKIQGPLVPPGFTTYIEMIKKKNINLPAPYETNCGEKKLQYSDSYSMHLCWLESVTNCVTELCNCKDHFMPGNHPVCPMANLSMCVWPNWEKHDKDKNYKNNCPLPCVIDSYEYKMSRSLYPNEEHVEVLKKIIPQELREPRDTKKPMHQFLRDNLLRIVLYYEELSYEIIEQKPSYDTQSWLGDIGGCVGLMVGASALSYFEFLDCLCLIVYTLLFDRKVKKKRQPVSGEQNKV